MVREGSISGEEVSVVLQGSEESLAKVICGSSQAKSARNSSPAKSLIRRLFLVRELLLLLLQRVLPFPLCRG